MSHLHYVKTSSLKWLEDTAMDDQQMTWCSKVTRVLLLATGLLAVMFVAIATCVLLFNVLTLATTTLASWIKTSVPEPMLRHIVQTMFYAFAFCLLGANTMKLMRYLRGLVRVRSTKAADC